MVSAAFQRGRDELFKRLKRDKVLTPELEQGILDVYGGRGKRALEVIKRGGVIRRGRRWFVRGKADEYEVVKNFCACRDYVMNIATGKAEVDCCYHALSKIICELLDQHYVEERKEKS